MTPWFARGPSRDGLAARGTGAEWSIDPSSLQSMLAYCFKLGMMKQEAVRRQGLNGQGTTYSLAFFLGPGFPRTFGGALGSTGATRLPGFFFTPSVGGGIDDDGVPTGAGVLFVSELFPSVAATFGCDVGAADGDSFFIDEASLLIDVDCGRNFCRDFGDNLKVMILLGFEDFRRAAAAGEGFVVEDIVVRWMVDGFTLKEDATMLS